MRSAQRLFVIASILVLSLPGSSGAFAEPQGGEHRLAHANGAGTLRVGQERFKITSVIVKLLDDHRAELTLISEITIFVTGTWTQRATSDQDFDLKITGGATGGGVEGTGTLILGKNSQSPLRLDVKGTSKTTKRTIEIHFQGK
jgi:hypothetical protein